MTKTKQQLPAKCSDKIQGLPDKTSANELANELIQLGKYEASKAMQAYEVTKEQSKTIRPKNYDDVLSSNTASLATLKKYRGQAIQQVFVYNEIKKLTEFFAVGKGMTDAAIEMLTELICETYYFLNVADFKLFLKKAVSHEFGTSYDRLDAPTVMGWLNIYVENRMQKSSANEMKRKAKLEKEMTGGIGEMPADFKKFVEIFSNKHKPMLDKDGNELILDKKNDSPTIVDGTKRIVGRTIMTAEDFRAKKAEFDAKQKLSEND